MEPNQAESFEHSSGDQGSFSPRRLSTAQSRRRKVAGHVTAAGWDQASFDFGPQPKSEGPGVDGSRQTGISEELGINGAIDTSPAGPAPLMAPAGADRQPAATDTQFPDEPAACPESRILLPFCPTEPRDAAVAEKISLYVFRQLIPLLRALRDAADGTEAGEA
jgi:hypothetical protein